MGWGGVDQTMEMYFTECTNENITQHLKEFVTVIRLGGDDIGL